MYFHSIVSIEITAPCRALMHIIPIHPKIGLYLYHNTLVINRRLCKQSAIAKDSYISKI